MFQLLWIIKVHFSTFSLYWSMYFCELNFYSKWIWLIWDEIWDQKIFLFSGISHWTKMGIVWECNVGGNQLPSDFEWRNCSVHCYSTCFAVLSMATRCQYMNKNNTWTRYLLEALTVNQCKASSSFLTYNAAFNRIMKLHTVHLQHPASHQTLWASGKEKGDFSHLVLWACFLIPLSHLKDGIFCNLFSLISRAKERAEI